VSAGHGNPLPRDFEREITRGLQPWHPAAAQFDPQIARLVAFREAGVLPEIKLSRWIPVPTSFIMPGAAVTLVGILAPDLCEWVVAESLCGGNVAPSKSCSWKGVLGFTSSSRCSKEWAGSLSSKPTSHQLAETGVRTVRGNAKFPAARPWKKPRAFEDAFVTVPPESFRMESVAADLADPVFESPRFVRRAKWRRSQSAV